MQSTINNIISKIIKEAIDKLSLCEAYNNLTKREFDSDMAKMGFVVRNGAGSRFIYIQPQYHTQITVHWHGGNIKASTLTNVRNELKNAGWFNDPKNLKLFPFQKWGFNPNQVVASDLPQNPSLVNSPYENAETMKIFYDSPICVLKFNNQYNLCKDEQDKTPLLQNWYDEYGYDDKTNSIPCLKKINQDFQIEAYPINQDGTLKEPIIENKLNKTQKIRLTESQLQNIIKEAVNEISASLANRAASKAYQQARESYGQYNNSMRESISRIVKKSINEMFSQN